ncbi:ATP-binding protein [Actinoplanes sp. NPDC023801]|uniref:sensor histidine kinase n=1 Tax=Actinoplanes sp. NPDC023801 TaxID=3154595 RepID=UPI0033FF8F20
MDPRRLAALQATGLIGDRLFPGLDRLTEMATRMLSAPIALVSLVDADRQWFASMVGLPEQWANARQTPLTHSFCQYVVDTQAPLVVTDARTEAMLRDNLAIGDLGVIAYAGYPLRAPEGEVLGTFCLADHQPRHWDTRELRLIEDLAAVAASEVAALLTAGHLAQGRRDAEQQRAFLDGLLDSLDTGVAACDAQGRLVLFNQALRQTLDADADPTLPPQQWARRFTVLHPDGRPFTADEMPLVRALTGKPVHDVAHLMIGRDRRRTMFRTHARPITGPDGDILGAVAASHDITERHRADQFRNAELAVHRACDAAGGIPEAAPEIVRSVGKALDWVHAELWLADELSDLLYPAATWSSPQHGAVVHVPPSISRGYGLAGTAWHTQDPVWLPDLTTDRGPLQADTVTAGKVQAALAVPVRGPQHALGALVVFAAHPEAKDTTCVPQLAGVANQIGVYLQRLRADDLTRQLIRSKDDYIALVGHELRTPLTSITANTELLDSTDDSTPLGEVRDMIEVIGRKTSQLAAVVDDLLDLAALDAGHLPLRIEPVYLAAVVHDSVTALTPAAEAGHVILSCDTPDQVVVHGSHRRLRQLLDNLIDNAIKYSPDGGHVDITLTHTHDVAELVITDTGIGIDPDEQEQVFHRLYRSEQVRHSGIPGTGLGLALCRVITELHHGTITISKAPDRHPGTRVTVRLPARAGDSHGSMAHEPQ